MLFRKFHRHTGTIKYYGRFLSKRQRKKILLIIFSAILLFITLVFMFRLRPLVSKMAVAAASDSITKAVNTAVNEKISDGSIDYSDMVMFEKDSSGKITALTTNMPKITVLQTQIVSRVIELINEDRINELSVPIGNLIGGNLFSGRGFGIPVKIVSIGKTSANFSNEFTSTGINQTRHQIILDVSVDINILIPTKVVRTTVLCQVSVAETIIVGDVPDSYTFFEDTGEVDSQLEKFDIAC